MQKDDRLTPATLLGQERDKIMADHMTQLQQEIQQAEEFVRYLQDKSKTK